MKLQQIILQDIAKENILCQFFETEEEIYKNGMETKELYARMSNTSFFQNGQAGIFFREQGEVTFDTFLNSFSTGKWKKYTIVDQLFLSLELKGRFEISLIHAWWANGQVQEAVLSTAEVNAEDREEVVLDFGKLKEDGIFYARIKSLSYGAAIYSGYYGTVDLTTTQDVKLAIDICTFKREQYVARNMNILKKNILENPDSPCYGKLWVHISDNASSLDGIVDTQKHITVDKNANLGGVGGFTRGIIETKKLEQQEKFTHILLMDDDATISSEAVEVNYLFLAYLKEEYFGYTIGGKLMVLNTPFIQFEVGAQWNEGMIKALKNEKDVRKIEEVLDSEIEDEPVEYQGWWYCCIPLQEIDIDNLPLPIFIHRDDVEYGMRTGRGRFIFLNQICIWHEAFAGKMPGVLDYYDIRNHCITNAIQCPGYSKKEFKRFLSKWVWRNIAKYRYKYVDYNIKAVEDFCKGIDWLLKTDGGELHKELFAMNYKAKPIEEYIEYKNFSEKDAKIRDEEYYNPPVPVRLFHKLTLNGYFFPTKRGKIVVTAPYGSVHKLYRRKRTIVVDSFNNGVYLERDRKSLWSCYQKLKDALKLIDEKYDMAAKSYHERYGELVSLDFWEKYLGI